MKTIINFIILALLSFALVITSCKNEGKDNSSQMVAAAALSQGSSAPTPVEEKPTENPAQPPTPPTPPELTYSGSPFTFASGSLNTIVPTVKGGSMTSCTSNPALPSGVIIDNSNCTITGLPLALQGATDYTITATNSVGSATAKISISVVLLAPSALTYTDSPYTFTNGITIVSKVPSKSGSPVQTCTSNPALPTGLTINTTTCAISGTPTVNQVATSYTITATNPIGSTTTTIMITVNAAPPSSLSYVNSPFTFTNGLAITTQIPTVTGTVTSCTSNPALPTGLSINATSCALSGTPSVTQGATSYTITASNAMGSTTASIIIIVNVSPPSSLTYVGSPYTFTNGTAIVPKTPTVTGTVTSCTSNPALPTGLSISSTCTISGTPTVNQTTANYTITASNISGNTTANISIIVNMSAPSALTYTGSPYTFTNGTTIVPKTPTVTGTVTNCTSSPTLPTGLAISSTTCAISGTPTVNQAATGYTITASNISGNTTASINITVNMAAPSALTYTGSPYTLANGVAMTTTPTVTGTITNCTVSPTLPTGLGINNTTCAISGTPTVNQAATSYTITASNISGNTTANISIGVALIIATPSFNPPAGHYTTQQNVAITTATPGATIYYTLFGATPGTHSSLYNSAFHIWHLAGKIVKAIAVKTGYTDSPILTGVFTYPPLKTGYLGTFGNRSDGDLQEGVARSYTDNGNGTITDNATGLLWQKCGYGYDASCTPKTPKITDWATAVSYCNSLSLVSKTWRLPTVEELRTIKDFKAQFFNSVYFPNTITGSYDWWTSTVYAPDESKAYTVQFTEDPMNYSEVKTNNNGVRCVSGPAYAEARTYTDNNNGTIKDNKTGLLWQKCSHGNNNDSTCSGTSINLTWSAALTYCNTLTLASKTWRLPNINELESLYEYGYNMAPFINDVYFPNPLPHYISSTPSHSITSYYFVLSKSFSTSPSGLIERAAGTSGVRCVANDN